MLYLALIAVSIIILLAIAFLLFKYLQVRKELEVLNNQTKALWDIEKLILNSLDFNKVTHDVVNETLKELSKYKYSILVLSLIDSEKKVLKRISISSTEQAKKALEFSPIPFSSIEIPLSAEGNLNIQSINNKKNMDTDKLADLLLPVIDPGLSSKAQTNADIKASLVYPVSVEGKVIGTMIFSMTKDLKKVSEEERTLLNSFTDLVGLAIQNSQLYTTLDTTSKQLSVVNEKLKELDELKNDFVSVASHELRTPMTAIRSYAWMALYKSDEPLSDRMKRYLSRTLISTERLINLVNDMLNISRIESGKIPISPVIFDVWALTHDVCQEVAAKAAEKVLDIKVMDARVPKVFADPDKVHQVLLNLLGNALKFSPREGLITISFFSDGQMVETVVKDSGVGISPEDLPRLFQKFGRLDNSYVASATSGGTGLGLYISKSLINLMKGKIWANSEGRGKGSSFIFTLPAATPQTLKEPEKFTHKVEGEMKQLEPVVV